MIYGSNRTCFPSRFLKEIPPLLIERIRPNVPAYKKPEPVRSASRASAWEAETRASFNGISAKRPEAAPKASSAYSVGMKVMHKVFGPGTVTAVVAMSSDSMLTVVFEKVGEKKLMANYANLEVL